MSCVGKKGGRLTLVIKEAELEAIKDDIYQFFHFALDFYRQ